MRWRIPLVLTLVLFVAVSCDQQPVEPVATAPSLDFGNGPPEAGVVLRSDDWEYWIVDLFWETPAEPWILWMGVGPGEAPSWCVGEDKRPNAESKWTGAKKGEKSNEVWKMNKVPVTVFDLQEHVDYFYQGLDLGEDPYCYAVTRATPIGSGEGNYRETGKWTVDSYQWSGSFNGTVDYMGETYRMQWKGEGEPFSSLVARVH